MNHNPDRWESQSEISRKGSRTPETETDLELGHGVGDDVSVVGNGVSPVKSPPNGRHRDEMTSESAWSGWREMTWLTKSILKSCVWTSWLDFRMQKRVMVKRWWNFLMLPVIWNINNWELNLFLVEIKSLKQITKLRASSAILPKLDYLLACFGISIAKYVQHACTQWLNENFYKLILMSYKNIQLIFFQRYNRIRQPIQSQPLIIFIHEHH